MKIYRQLVALSPVLEERLMTGSEQDIYHAAGMVIICAYYLPTATYTHYVLVRSLKDHRQPAQTTPGL
jgi:hypothetical protein